MPVGKDKPVIGREVKNDQITQLLTSKADGCNSEEKIVCSPEEIKMLPLLRGTDFVEFKGRYLRPARQVVRTETPQIRNQTKESTKESTRRFKRAQPVFRAPLKFMQVKERIRKMRRDGRANFLQNIVDGGVKRQPFNVTKWPLSDQRGQRQARTSTRDHLFGSGIEIEEAFRRQTQADTSEKNETGHQSAAQNDPRQESEPRMLDSADVRFLSQHQRLELSEALERALHRRRMEQVEPGGGTQKAGTNEEEDEQKEEPEGYDADYDEIERWSECDSDSEDEDTDQTNMCGTTSRGGHGSVADDLLGGDGADDGDGDESSDGQSVTSRSNLSNADTGELVDNDGADNDDSAESGEDQYAASHSDESAESGDDHSVTSQGNLSAADTEEKDEFSDGSLPGLIPSSSSEESDSDDDDEGQGFGEDHSQNGSGAQAGESGQIEYIDDILTWNVGSGAGSGEALGNTDLAGSERWQRAMEGYNVEYSEAGAHEYNGAVEHSIDAGNSTLRTWCSAESIQDPPVARSDGGYDGSSSADGVRRAEVELWRSVRYVVSTCKRRESMEPLGLDAAKFLQVHEAARGSWYDCEAGTRAVYERWAGHSQFQCEAEMKEESEIHRRYAQCVHMCAQEAAGTPWNLDTSEGAGAATDQQSRQIDRVDRGTHQGHRCRHIDVKFRFMYEAIEDGVRHPTRSAQHIVDTLARLRDRNTENMISFASWAIEVYERRRARKARQAYESQRQVGDTITEQEEGHSSARARVELSPLSTVSRMEPYRMTDEFSGQTFMFHGINMRRVLQCYQAREIPGKILHLVDSGSTIFLSPHEHHLIIKHACDMPVNGIGSGRVETWSPTVFGVLTQMGKHHLMACEQIFFMPHLGFPILATGPLELQGYTFRLALQGGCMTTPEGTAVPLYKCAMTGYHWLVEETSSRKALMAKQHLIDQFHADRENTHPPPHLRAEPSQIDFTHATDEPGNLYHLVHAQIADAIRGSIGVMSPETCASENEAHEAVSEIIEELERKQRREETANEICEATIACNCALCSVYRNDDGTWNEGAARVCQRRIGCKCSICRLMYSSDGTWAGGEIGDAWAVTRSDAKKNEEAGSAVKAGAEESDDKIIRETKIKLEAKKSRNNFKMRMPPVRFKDNGEPRNVQRIRQLYHETLGHLACTTQNIAVEHVDGGEMLKFINDEHGKRDDVHCDSCAKMKSKVSPSPDRKTLRAPRLEGKLKKGYVDLSGYIAEASAFHNYHYYVAMATEYGYGYQVGLTYRSQALLGLARIFAEAGGAPSVVQVDGEGNLNSKVAESYIAGRGSELITTEAGAHFRNGRIENRHSLWKAMTRAMLDCSGLDISFWHFALSHAVLISNLCLLATGKNDSYLKMSVWERHYGEKPDVGRYLLGPFGCLCYLILTDEQRRDRNLSKHFGIRSIAGLYLGTWVNPESGVYHHIVTDGRTPFASPNCARCVPDVYPMKLSRRDIELIPTERHDMEEEAVLFVQEWAAAAKEGERKCDGEDSPMTGESFPAQKGKGLSTQLKGQDRVHGRNKRRPMQIVASLNDQGEVITFEPGREIDPDVDMNHEPPDSYEIEPLPVPFRHEKPYNGAKYLILVPVDFKDEKQVPKETDHPHKRFIGRAVRKEFHIGGDEAKPRKPFLGKVVGYSAKRQIFEIGYEDGDGEDLDFVQMTDILIMGEEYGDPEENWGRTRTEMAMALTFAAVLATMWEENFYRVPGDEMDSYCHIAAGEVQIDKSRAVIYDDEPRNPREVERHPEREEIEEAGRKEVQQWIEMGIGAELSPEDRAAVEADESIRILNAKMVYKRKYVFDPVDQREYFLKWKGRLAVVGTSEVAGLDLVWSTFSPTLGFAAIRTLISAMCHPKYNVGSYDLTGFFLGAPMEDRAVYVRLPKDATGHAGKVLRLLKCAYGLRSASKDSVALLGKLILEFEERVDTEAGTKDFRFRKLGMDHCIYRYVDDNGNEMIVAHFVDDLIVATTDEELRARFIRHLNKMWKITYEGTLDRFIGVNFRRDDDGWGWKATMTSYIDRLAERYDVKECRHVDVPMDPGFVLKEEDFKEDPTPEMISHYRSIIGSIGYAAIAVRFDIAHAVSVLSRHLARPCRKVVDAGKRVIRYLVTHREVGIHWRNSQRDIDAGNAYTLLGCTDASFAMDTLTRKSHGGYINFVNSGAVSWKSGLQPIVTLSSCEAEYVALCTEVCEVKYLRQLLRELGHEQVKPTLIQEDNKAAILVAENETSSSGRCKHIDVKFRFVHEAIKDGVVRVRYVPTDHNLADILTKPMGPTKFERMLKLCLANKYSHLYHESESTGGDGTGDTGMTLMIDVAMVTEDEWYDMDPCASSMLEY